MPFVSEAQKRRFKVLLAARKISKRQFKEFERDTPRKLPERLHPKKKGKK